jgi:leader peptidase (prepilin peptidase)/N-methyltransferase
MGFLWSEIFWLTFVFCIGASVGSFLNVVVARLPLEKSLIWPGSRCGSCLQPIRGSANLPIISYLLLRGRCRTCGARFSSRYMWVELGTALAFSGLFYLDVLANWQDVDFVRNAQGQIAMGWVPWDLWAFFGHHALLMSFLIAASLCDLDGRIIPLPLTVTGTTIGLLLATLMPWPWPSQAAFNPPPGAPWGFLNLVDKLPRGVYNWPLWGPLPDWLPRESWQLGLLTGLAGAAAGNLMMRSIKFIFEQGMGKEALGLGDADLMMMAGAFLGWQMVLVSFFFGTFAALFIAVPMFLVKGSRLLPFGPGLAVGIMVTLLFWRRIGAYAQPFFFDWLLLFVGATIMGGGMFVASLLLGWKRS